MTASVSAIIPAFNAEGFCAEAIESVLAQTVRPIEVIVVDDGSTDGTRAVAERYGPPVVVLSQPQSGVPFARNAGARLARGEWLAFLDADDVWRPDKIERQLALATSEVAVVYSDRENVGALEGLPRIQSELTTLRDGDVFEALLCEGNMVTMSSALVHRDAFASVGGFLEDRRIQPCEDWDLWIRLAERHRFVASPEPLVKYRVHAGSLSRSFVNMNNARLFVIERALALERAGAFPSSLKRRVLASTFRTNGWDAARHGGTAAAAAAYFRALTYSPFHLETYAGLARLALGRS